MNCTKKILALVIISGVFGHYSNVLGLFKVNVHYSDTSKRAVANCTGGNNMCNVTIGAVGDVVTLDVSGKAQTDLGTFAKDQLISLDLPDAPNTYKIYSFEPSSGDLTGKKITLLMQNVPQKPGSRLYGNTVFKLSRQVEGDQPTQWMWVADFIMLKGEKLTPMPFIVKADGTFITFDTAKVKGKQPLSFNPSEGIPQGVRQEIIYIGSKNLNR